MRLCVSEISFPLSTANFMSILKYILLQTNRSIILLNFWLKVNLNFMYNSVCALQQMCGVSMSIHVAFLINFNIIIFNKFFAFNILEYSCSIKISDTIDFDISVNGVGLDASITLGKLHLLER